VATPPARQRPRRFLWLMLEIRIRSARRSARDSVQSMGLISTINVIQVTACSFAPAPRNRPEGGKSVELDCGIGVGSRKLVLLMCLAFLLYLGI
jgi:hypothetical protein